MIDPGNPIVNARIEYFKKRKAVALTKKKDERGNELQFCDDAIARLKRWNRELYALKIRKDFERAGLGMKKAMIPLIENMQAFKKAVESLNPGGTILQSKK